MYHTFAYRPYADPLYYPEYPIYVEGAEATEKARKEYVQEALMEQEAMRAAYYGGAYYAAAYGALHSMEHTSPAPVPVAMTPRPHKWNVDAAVFVPRKDRHRPLATSSEGVLPDALQISSKLADCPAAEVTESPWVPADTPADAAQSWL